MLSAQNAQLPHLGADLRPNQPEPRRAVKIIMVGGKWVSVVHDLVRYGDGWIEQRADQSPFTHAEVTS